MNHTDNSCSLMMPLKCNQDSGQSHSIPDSAPFFATDVAKKVKQHRMQSSEASSNLDITTDECKNMASSKSEQWTTLCDEATEKVYLTLNSEDDAATCSNSLSPRRIEITKDLTLSLVPRIKMNFIICCPGDSHRYLPKIETKLIVMWILEDDRFFTNPISLPYEDIHVCYICPPKMTDDNVKVLVEGSFYIRNRCLNSMEFLLKKETLEKMHTYKMEVNDIAYQVRAFLPAFSEDPCEMMASVSGLTQDPPTIMLKGIPSQWFSDQPDSSEPSERLLHIFLGTFGKVRHLDFVADNEFGKDGRTESEVSGGTLYCKVFVQYDKFKDCENALRSLCAHSLHKDSSMVADYEVLWKEHEVESKWPSAQGVHFPNKQTGSEDSGQVENTLTAVISGLEQQVESLKHLIRDLRAKEGIAMV